LVILDRIDADELERLVDAPRGMIER